MYIPDLRAVSRALRECELRMRIVCIEWHDGFEEFLEDMRECDVNNRSARAMVRLLEQLKAGTPVCMGDIRGISDASAWTVWVSLCKKVDDMATAWPAELARREIAAQYLQQVFGEAEKFLAESLPPDK